MLPRREKVLAYITNRGRLLLLLHPDHPEAGIQVPGGTLRPGERPEEGVLREAHEETGLQHLEVHTYLGEAEFDRRPLGSESIDHRHFFHLRCPGDPPETWQWYEEDPSEGEERRIAFEFRWAALPDEVPALIADQGQFLPGLLEILAIPHGAQ